MKTGRGFSLEGLEPRQLLSLPGGSTPGSSVLLSPALLPGEASPGVAMIQPADASTSQAGATLSAAASMISTSPADGSTMTHSPDALVIIFNQEVDFLWTDGNIQLEQVNSDGTTTPILDALNPPVASFDGTGTQATIPIDSSLPAGHYRIVLVGDSGLSVYLSGADPVTLTGGQWDPSVDQTLANFTIAPSIPVTPSGATLSNATDLGIIGSQVVSTSGWLDLTGGATSVTLYKLTLGPGHYWQLGAELNAQRIGSPLMGALTLFDQQGNVLATRDSGTGLVGSPNDPYLFTGLLPGVYYIGLSGAGNLAGQPGGYNPVTGTNGTAGLKQAGGGYDLRVVADAADSLTQLTNFTLQWGDPLGSSPTGMNLNFSGPISLDSLRSSSAVSALRFRFMTRRARSGRSLHPDICLPAAW